MHLQILPLNATTQELYANHGTFHAGDSGLDLFVQEDQTVKAGETAFLKLGVKAAAFNTEGKGVSWLLMPRSSISKTPLRLANSIGLIDAGYRGEVMAAVDNIKTVDFTVKKGERYFQAVAFGGEPIQMTVVDSLDETARGEGGFGSTTAKKLKIDGDIENKPSVSGA
jgi:dUTP pyrophosphatase